MTKSTLTILFALFCLTGTGALSQETASTQQLPLLTFGDLQQNAAIEGPFKIVGFVIDIYKCPPCPPGAMCKPCIGDHIVLTDNVDEKNPAGIKRLTIYTPKPEQFELKKRYSLTVKVRGKIPTGEAIQRAELISFEPLKDQ